MELATSDHHPVQHRWPYDGSHRSSGLEVAAAAAAAAVGPGGNLLAPDDVDVFFHSLDSNGNPVYRRVPFLEMFGTEAVARENGIIAIKTHFPFKLVPYSSEAKYIYIARNPKDTVVSLYHHTCTAGYLFEDGTFDDLFELFLNGETEFGDYFDHVRSWYAHREDDNVLFLTYEELKRDTRGGISKIARFMGEKYVEMLNQNSDIMENIVKYSSLEHMKDLYNKQGDNVTADRLVTKEDIDAMPIPIGLKHVRKFILDHRKPTSKYIRHIREGSVGGWMKVFSEEQAKRMNEKIEETFFRTELYELWK